MQVDLNQIDALLVELNGNLATVQTDIGSIITGIENIELKVTSIQGDTASITTTLGDLNGTITAIQGDIATIKTDIGEIKVTLLLAITGDQEGIHATALWRANVAVLAIGAATVILSAFMILKKKA